MSITQGLHRGRQQNPDKVATICCDRVRSFEEQFDRVSRLAGGLRQLGVERGDRIVIAAQNSDRYAELLLASTWLGAVSAPLNTRWSAHELMYAINDVESGLLAVDATCASRVEGLRRLSPQIRDVLFIGDGAVPDGTISVEQVLAQSSAVDEEVVNDSELAAVFYTGGTTGRPKGVMLSHGNLITAALGALATADFMTQGGVAMHVAPMFHLAGLWPWVSEMALGGAHVFIPAFDVDTVVDAIRDNAVTDVLLVPAMIQLLVARLREMGHGLTSLRHLIYAGSPMPESLLDATQDVLPGVRLVQGYGMTELAPVATLLSAEDHIGRRRRSVGRPAPHSLVRIVDPLGVEVPRGESGEVAVSGGQVMMGYWNNPELTAQTIRNGWMHTGDLGFMDEDGFVYIVDRIKDVIITGAENVYSVEVENALMSHPSIVTCAVVGVPDAKWGERVHAFIVVADKTELTLEEVQTHASKRIARYKIPRSFEVVDSLPVSAAGKILKHELRKQYSPEKYALEPPLN